MFDIMVPTWHAMSVLGAHMARLGHRIEYLTQFKNLDGRFESLEI